jgi:hypothetical protein
LWEGQERLLKKGPIAFFHLLELRQAYAGQGLGVALLALARTLRQEIGLHYGFLEPVPLQFTPPFPTRSVSRQDKADYQDAKRRLTAYYERTLGVTYYGVALDS